MRKLKVEKEQLTFLPAERPAKVLVSRDSAKAWMTRVAISCSPILQFLTDTAPAGWSGRMSPVSCRLTEDGLLAPCLEGWQNAGMGSHTGFLTLSTSEWPSDAAVCLLSDTLETGDLPQRYFLSATACKGILRRAEKRGKALPPALDSALQAVSQGALAQS